MLTVSLGLEGSGKRSTRNPFGYEYSVIPPKVDCFSTPRGSVCENTGSASAKVSIIVRILDLKPCPFQIEIESSERLLWLRNDLSKRRLPFLFCHLPWWLNHPQSRSW